MPVYSRSEWQKRFQAFTEEQVAFLEQARSG
jgi:hypothetical protein